MIHQTVPTGCTSVCVVMALEIGTFSENAQNEVFRNLHDNLSDLRAQVAANQKVTDLMVARYFLKN